MTSYLTVERLYGLTALLTHFIKPSVLQTRLVSIVGHSYKGLSTNVTQLKKFSNNTTELNCD